MKRNFKRIFILSITLFLSLCLPVLVQAQPCVGPDPETGECPIDNGLLVLLTIGVGYGIKKVVDSRKARAIE